MNSYNIIEEDYEQIKIPILKPRINLDKLNQSYKLIVIAPTIYTNRKNMNKNQYKITEKFLWDKKMMTL